MTFNSMHITNRRLLRRQNVKVFIVHVYNTHSHTFLINADIAHNTTETKSSYYITQQLTHMRCVCVFLKYSLENSNKLIVSYFSWMVLITKTLLYSIFQMYGVHTTDYTTPIKTISFPKYQNVEEKNFKSTLFSEANGITIPTKHNFKWEEKIIPKDWSICRWCDGICWKFTQGQKRHAVRVLNPPNAAILIF